MSLGSRVEAGDSPKTASGQPMGPFLAVPTKGPRLRGTTPPSWPDDCSRTLPAPSEMVLKNRFVSVVRPIHSCGPGIGTWLTLHRGPGWT